MLMGLSGSQLWVVYGSLLHDPWMTWSALSGTIVNMYCVVTAVALLGILYGKMALANTNADRKEQKALEEDLYQLRNVQYGLTALLAGWGAMYVFFFVHQPYTLKRTTELIGTICSVHYYVYFARYLPQVCVV